MKKWQELENDGDFKMLHEKYCRPDLAVFMDKRRREVIHSDLLRWFLDPVGNHKLGTFALEHFLQLLESKRGNFSIKRKDLENTRFTTEHSASGGRMDVFGENDFLIIVIENKIKAGETWCGGRPQSVVYADYCEEKYQNKQRVYVLLKATSETEVENRDFISVTYQDLYDWVIEPAREFCRDCEGQELGATAGVLEQYALCLSSPFIEKRLAYTEKEAVFRIYEKYADVFEEIRNDIRENGPDSGSDLYNFFNKYEMVINGVILESLGKNIIEKVPKKMRMDGKEAINKLVGRKIIILGETELLYCYKGATCIIKLDEEFNFHIGYYKGKYNGKAEVAPLPYVSRSVHKAAVEVEKALGSDAENGGKSALELKLLFAGIEEANGKTIREALTM